MTVQEVTTAETTVAEKQAGNPSFDIKKALQDSTSDVSVDELQKKGFRQVKVLDKAMILRLIRDSVDRVIASRAEELSKKDREWVIHEAEIKIREFTRKRFSVEEGLAAQVDEHRDRASALEKDLGDTRAEAEKARTQNGKEFVEARRRLEALEKEVASARDRVEKSDAVRAEHEKTIDQLNQSVDRLTETVKDREKEVEELRQQFAERDQQIGELRQEPEEPSGPPTPSLEGLLVALLDKFQDQPQQEQSGQGLSALQSSIAGLADKINMLGAGGGGGGGVGVIDKDVLLERLFSRDTGTEMESNVANVSVKHAKASGVKNTLDKLRALQQGGSKDGD